MAPFECSPGASGWPRVVAASGPGVDEASTKRSARFFAHHDGALSAGYGHHERPGSPPVVDRHPHSAARRAAAVETACCGEEAGVGRGSRRAIGSPQDKAAGVFARFPSRFQGCPAGVFRARASLSRRVSEIASDVDALQPDSGDFGHGTHTGAVQLSIKHSNSLRRRLPLTLLVVGGADAGLAYALDLRVNATVSMPIDHYREVPARIERGAWVVFCLPPERARVGRKRG